jgi:hypothetical protein
VRHERRNRARKARGGRCCVGDGGRPPGIALQGEVPNHRKLRWHNGRGGERCGKGVPGGRQVRARKANASEPLMKCRKRIDDVETGKESLTRDQPGGHLSTAQAASGMKAARAWLRLLRGTCEPANSIPELVGEVPGIREGGPQVEETARGRVPRRGAGTDCPVVARRPGNAGGAKGAGCPGLLAGQPWVGRSR